MASKRGAPNTPLSSEPAAQQMVLRNRLPGISDTSEVDRSSVIYRGRGGKGNGRGGSRGRGRGGGGMGRQSGSSSSDYEENFEKGVGRGDGAATNLNNSRTENLNQNIAANNEATTNTIQFESATETLNEPESYSISQMLNFAKENKFPQKTIWFGTNKKYYTPVLHFFKHNSEFETKPEKKTSIKFECKEEGCILNEYFGDFGNLNKHLKLHSKGKRWYELYIKEKNKESSESGISPTKILLIKFFITSNLALKQLENVYLRKCLKDEINMPCIKTFKFNYLVEVFSKMKVKIGEKCNEAEYITLVPDGWSDDPNTHYLGRVVCNYFKIFLKS